MCVGSQTRINSNLNPDDKLTDAKYFQSHFIRLTTGESVMIVVGLGLTALLICALITRSKEPPPRQAGDWHY
jgi:hypothetical protein